VSQKKLFILYTFFILIRVFLIFNYYPEIQSKLFIPFIENAVKANNFDIWYSWISNNGRSDAFPYGIGMVVPLIIPIILVSKFLILSDSLIHIIFGGIILAFDAYTLKTLIKVTQNFKSALMYAFSPLAIYISYFHGQIDLIPAILFLLALINLKSRKMILSGIFLGLTISAKLSFLLVVPFLIIYYFKNFKFRNSLNKLFMSSSFTLLIFQVPLLFSTGFQTMVLETPEAYRIFNYNLNLASTTTILIFPAAYIGLLLWLWRTGRTTVDVLISFFTASLFTIAIFSPGAIGWLFWSLPLLAYISSKKSTSFFLITFIFQIISIATYADQQKGAVSKIRELDLISILNGKGIMIQSLLETAFFCVGIILILSILRTAVSSGDIYGLNLRPASIAIAGDSGVGKDLLANNLKNIFGSQATSIIYGDNYHKFERDSLKWREFTHLNPEANDLKLLISDVQKSLNREQISRKIYDHKIGRFLSPKQIAPSDFVILNGLHSLSLGKTQELIDLNIFLSMSEELRSKLKMKRDVTDRNLSTEFITQQISARREDVKKYIQSQSDDADIIFEITQSNEDLNQIENLELRVETKRLNFLQDIAHFLRIHTECNLDFKMKTADIHSLNLRNIRIDLYILDKMMEIMLPEKNQIIFENYGLKSGVQGLMTLISILGLAEKRIGTKEIIYD
jgi:uridine kinase